MQHNRFVKRAAFAALSLGALGATALVAARARQTPASNTTSIPLVTGKSLTPQGTQTEVGSFPANAVLSPDGKYVVVSSLGTRARLSVLDVQTGKLVSKVDFDGPHPTGAARKREGLYYGLAFGPGGDTGAMLYAARGSDERVSILTLRSDGTLTRTERELLLPSGRKQKSATGKETDLPAQIAGIASNRDGSRLYVTDNSGDPAQNMESILTVVDTTTGRATMKVPVPGYPFAVTALTTGPNADKKVYVTSEQRGLVLAVDVVAGKVTRRIETGVQPDGLVLDRAQKRLFVANGGSDTVSIIDTESDRVQKTILLRPADAHGLPGATPTAMTLSPNEKTLYVTLADLNAVAVVDLEKNAVSGYVPVGWYPTGVVVSPDGKRLFVANAKGVAVRNPNGVEIKPEGTGKPTHYIQDIIEGTVSTVDLDAATRNLPRLTEQVIANNHVQPDMLKVAQSTLKNPGIEHIIYIIKENRTYDQVLGDLPQGNGDPSLVLFGRDVTPNQHALAERFVLLDNFYCCAEVSGDGWNWSTGGMVSEYGARNVVYGYTGKIHPYDYEGTNNGIPVDLDGIPDVARPAGGYIWESCARKKIPFRNYGFFADDFDRPRRGAEEGSEGLKNAPVQRSLVGKSYSDFRQFDTDYADGEAWLKAGVTPAPSQLKAYGSHNDPSRFTAWKREFAGYVQDGKLPRFSMIRMGRDHTAGTKAGGSSPRAMVADNDYAVGQVVEAVSKSPYWKKTAIFIVEDDAQNGYDHIDAHRSIAFVISPFVRKGTHDNRFYNTDSMLHTMENLLGLPPMTLYDAIAPTLAIFTEKPENATPYEAILPAKEIVGEVNGKAAYRAADSARLLNPLREESGPDEELNDILWHSIKGPHIPAPERRYGLRMRSGTIEDDD